MPGSFRDLPSVDEVLGSLGRLAASYPRGLIVSEVRRAIERARTEIRAGREPGDIQRSAEAALAELAAPSLRRVINATGVVLHTNLGRAPLRGSKGGGGYSNLEYDVATGRRGKRDVHVGGLLERLLGAPAIAVNNNAAAVYLALRELASGGEAIVSRGELIEIGDGFRIPDIMRESGAVLREVGTTNRTSIEDYRAAVTDRTRVILRVHPSNFRIAGFTSKPELRELVALGRESGVPVYEDLGSGCITDLRPFGIQEPLVGESLEAGVDLVSFSGDKLMGGPQAGILAGKPEIVARLRRNPMYRALRLDKLILHALETALRNTLLEQWNEVPALAMIRQSSEEIRERADRVAAAVPGAEIVPGESVIGGGSTPEQTLPTWLVALAGDVVKREAALRRNDPPVIARIADERLLLDLRTVFPEEEAALVEALNRG
ncbi:MAG TPA: L-seryl-tRNA(Sec) selenium transferase [Bryobacteraceae bacterium]|nr:L-seryl-tRNA(Sec) selenium transferase [Bryobacteraceae bacterium]